MITTKRKAIFLDRDGVLNVDPGTYTYSIERIDIVEGILDALRVLKKRGYVFVLITNQGGIAKKIYGHKEAKAVNGFILDFFGDHAVPFLDHFYCPHHSVVHKCLCRKPGSLMLEKALAKHQIAKELSYFVGDKDSDAEAAVRAGVQPITIERNSDLREYLHLIA